MEVKRIDQLPEAASPQVTDLLALYQSDGTKKVKLEDIQASGPAGPAGPAGAAGKDGEDGKDGAPGADGFSPTVDIKKEGKTTTVTITDKTGPHVATIEDGKDGSGGGGGVTQEEMEKYVKEQLGVIENGAY